MVLLFRGLLLYFGGWGVSNLILSSSVSLPFWTREMLCRTYTHMSWMEGPGPSEIRSGRVFDLLQRSSAQRRCNGKRREGVIWA